MIQLHVAAESVNVAAEREVRVGEFVVPDTYQWFTV